MSLSNALRALSHKPVVCLVVFLLFVPLLGACASPPAAPHFDVSSVPAVPSALPRPINLPADEASHNSLTEWWYCTGHLTSASQKRYGFELVFFQSVRGRNPIGYAAHFAVTDHQRATFAYDQRSETALKIQGDGRYALSLGDWRLQGDGDDHALQARGDRYAIDLKLHSTKPPALHGGIGLISFGPAGDSYYYSRTRMDVGGTLRDGDEREQVAGLAWMDHQWGDFLSPGTGGWDWFSVQLRDGTELMATILRDQAGNTSAQYGSYVEPDGRVTDLRAGDVEVKATDRWQSPRTGAVYPSGWTVRVPSQGLDLTLQPVLPDQELDARQTTGVTYWEGEVQASGTRNGLPIEGAGYVELTWYE